MISANNEITSRQLLRVSSIIIDIWSELLTSNETGKKKAKINCKKQRAKPRIDKPFCETDKNSRCWLHVLAELQFPPAFLKP